MKVSAKAEYACLAIIALASRRMEDPPARIREIAERHGIPERYLVQILLQLKGAGLVNSTRGASGGYRLARPAAEMTLGEVLGAIDGPSEPSRTVNGPAVRRFGDRLGTRSGRRAAVLDQTSVAQLAERASPRDWVI